MNNIEQIKNDLVDNAIEIQDVSESTGDTKVASNLKLSFTKKVEIVTRNPKNYKILWWTIFGLTCFIILLAGIVLGLNYNEPAKVVELAKAVPYVSILTASKAFAFMSIIVIVFPYLYLSGSWIAGVNNTSKGPIYQIFLWSCYIVATLFAVLAFILYWTMWIAI